jgi:hypothetical protein
MLMAYRNKVLENMATGVGGSNQDEMKQDGQAGL